MDQDNIWEFLISRLDKTSKFSEKISTSMIVTNTPKSSMKILDMLKVKPKELNRILSPSLRLNISQLRITL